MTSRLGAAGEERDRQQVNYWCFRAVIEGMTRKGNSIGLALTGQPNGGTQGKSVHYLGSDLLVCPGILIFCTTSKLSLCFVHTLALVFFCILFVSFRVSVISPYSQTPRILNSQICKALGHDSRK